MDRFFCVLLLCALLLTGALIGMETKMQEAEPVFFSLLFPQLMPTYDEEQLTEQTSWWGAVLL